MEYVSRDTAITASALFGFAGLDRIYLGCYSTGFMKFLLFLVFMIAASFDFWKTANDVTEAKMLFVLVILLWYFYDLYKITTGGIKSTAATSFCEGYTWVDSDYTPYYASFVLALVFTMLGLWLYYSK